MPCEGSPTKINYRKRVPSLILTSPLEDLDLYELYETEDAANVCVSLFYLCLVSSSSLSICVFFGAKHAPSSFALRGLLRSLRGAPGVAPTGTGNASDRGVYGFPNMGLSVASSKVRSRGAGERLGRGRDLKDFWREEGGLNLILVSHSHPVP